MVFKCFISGFERFLGVSYFLSGLCFLVGFPTKNEEENKKFMCNFYWGS